MTAIFFFKMIEFIEDFFSAKFEFCEFKVGIFFFFFSLLLELQRFLDKNGEYK